MIRPAHPTDDFDKVLYGAGEFVRYINRPDILPEPGSAQLASVVRSLFSVPGFSVLLAEDQGQLRGAIGFWVGNYLMNPDKRELQELFWWSDRSAPLLAMKLLRAAKKAGVDAGCSIFTWHRLTVSPDGVDSAYRSIGAVPMQVSYVGCL